MDDDLNSPASWSEDFVETEEWPDAFDCFSEIPSSYVYGHFLVAHSFSVSVPCFPLMIMQALMQINWSRGESSWRGC
jgi:hypothetical protein